MLRLRGRLGRALKRPNPMVLAGVTLLAAGIAIRALGMGSGDGPTGGSEALNRAITGIIRFVQTAILRGDLAMSETQPRFNSVVLTVVLNELAPGPRQRLSAIAATATGLLSDVASAAGLLTLAALAAAYVASARLFDSRWPGARGA